MISNTSAWVNLLLGGLIYILVLSIPIYIVWLLIKALKRISRIETIEQELVKLKDEVRSLRESLTGKND